MIAGRGLEVVLTLGTGIGSAVFLDGWLAPHLELAQHPLHREGAQERRPPLIPGQVEHGAPGDPGQQVVAKWRCHKRAVR